MKYDFNKPTLLGNLTSIVVSTKDILVAGTTKIATVLEDQSTNLRDKAEAKTSDKEVDTNG